MAKSCCRSRRSICLSVIGVLIGHVGIAGADAGASVTVSYEQIPSFVHEKNEHVHGAELRERSVEVLRGSLRRSFLPHVEAGIGFEAFKTGPLSWRNEPYGFLDARLNLYNGARDRLGESAVDEDARTASTERMSVIADEIAKARKLFWALVASREEMRLFEDALASNSKYIQSASHRIRAGVGTETDRIEFELARLQLEQDLERKRLQSKNLERELAVIIGLPPGAELQLPDGISHEHDDQILQRTIDSSQHRAVKADVSQGKAASLRAEAARRVWWPSVNLLGSQRLYTFRDREYTDQGDRWESVVGLELRFDAFDGYSSQIEAQSLALQAEAFERRARQTASELGAEAETARAELSLTHRLIHDSEINLSKTKAYLTNTLDEYRRGVKSSPDVLNAAERFFDIQRRYLELRRDYQLARVDLMNKLDIE